MNPLITDNRHHSDPPPFLRQVGAGHWLAGAGLAAGAAGTRASQPPAMRRAAALRAEGEARHLPASERRAAARRLVRLQAEAEEMARQGDPGRAVHGGQALQHDDGGQDEAVPCSARSPSFKQHGKSGAWVSDFLPHTASIADDLCFIKSMHTDAGQSRAGHHVLPDRRRAAGPAEHGRVAELRPGQRTRTCRRSS